MKLTKGEGAVVSLFPITCYLTTYYKYVAENQYTFNLMLLFSLGVFFIFFRVLKEDEELMFLDKGTGVYWGEGYCLVPSFLPFLRNIGINFPWGLRNRRLERVREVIPNNININHYHDQREMSYRVNVETTLLQANLHRLFGNLIGWIFGINRGDPEFLFQRIGFRIMLLALILGWGANMVSKKPFEEKVNGTVSEFIEINPGQCVNIPDGVTANIRIKTLPVNLTNNINNVIHIYSSNGKIYPWSWSNAFRDRPVFSEQQNISTKTIRGDGQICF